MLSVNQMFYGTDEPVWLVDGATPNPVKYHYLGSAHRATAPPPVARRTRDPYYPYDEDPYYSSSRRRDAYYNPPTARSVRQPSYYNAPTPPPLVATVPYSSDNLPPAPVVVPAKTPLTHTPVVPVVPPTVPANIPYVSLLVVLLYLYHVIALPCSSLNEEDRSCCTNEKLSD
jgi:hypothetical protein